MAGRIASMVSSAASSGAGYPCFPRSHLTSSATAGSRSELMTVGNGFVSGHHSINVSSTAFQSSELEQYGSAPAKPRMKVVRSRPHGHAQAPSRDGPVESSTSAGCEAGTPSPLIRLCASMTGNVPWMSARTSANCFR